MPLPRATGFVHEILASRLAPGACVLDATVGNGHDTAFLARAVGPRGQVVGLDVQAEAVEATRRRLAGLRPPEEIAPVALHQIGHERLAELVPGPLDAAVFNLGYLPRGDKAVTTRAESTLPALEQALALLAPGGLLSIAAYPGHETGRGEAEAVLAWAAALDQGRYAAVRYGFLNQRGDPPFVVMVEKRS